MHDPEEGQPAGAQQPPGSSRSAGEHGVEFAGSMLDAEKHMQKSPWPAWQFSPPLLLPPVALPLLPPLAEPDGPPEDEAMPPPLEDPDAPDPPEPLASSAGPSYAPASAGDPGADDEQAAAPKTSARMPAARARDIWLLVVRQATRGPSRAPIHSSWSWYSGSRSAQKASTRAWDSSSSASNWTPTPGELSGPPS